MKEGYRARRLEIDFIDGSRKTIFVGRKFLMPAKNNFDLVDIDGDRHVVNMDKVKSLWVTQNFKPRPPQPPR